VRHRRLAVVLAALVLLAALLIVLRRPEQLYATHVRPDGLYRVEVYRRAAIWGLMPGQSSDAPGRVVLLDRAGNVLGEADVEMVQLADNIAWGADSVAIRAVVDWPLPATGPSGDGVRGNKHAR
jgi:hypothetical protein